ncbi:hypothetical protein GF354_03305 [Candidatus Peregrinibacteria bacterium]|nr:hypothetical protein [Candidatus Peregrinibacteria bacterium]
MKTSYLKKYFVYILSIFFLIAIGSIYLNSFYYEKVDEYNEEIFPTLNLNSFSVVLSDKNINLPEEFGRFGGTFFALSPGDKLNTNLILKNHDKFSDHQYKIVFEESLKYDLKKGETIENYDGAVPSVDFTRKNRLLTPEGVEVIPISIEVPENIEKGVYRLFIRTTAVDPSASGFSSDGIKFNLAIGTKIYILIDQTPMGLIYKDLTVQAEKLSSPWLLVGVGNILTFVFIVLTFLFLYFAFKFDKPKSK